MPFHVNQEQKHSVTSAGLTWLKWILLICGLVILSEIPHGSTCQVAYPTLILPQILVPPHSLSLLSIFILHQNQPGNFLKWRILWPQCDWVYFPKWFSHEPMLKITILQLQHYTPHTWGFVSQIQCATSISDFRIPKFNKYRLLKFALSHVFLECNYPVLFSGTTHSHSCKFCSSW
jgi:hypothetical protein